MTLPPAALPGFKAQAPVEYHDHPGDAVLLGCPSCGATDDLVLDVPAVAHHRVKVRAIEGVTRPEADIDSDDVLPIDEFPERPTKIRCLRCQWSYTGPDPASRCQPPRA